MISEFAFHGSKTPRAIVVLIPGSNGDGRYMIHEREWVKFATEFDLLLVGCFFRDDFPRGIEDYCSMQKGAGEKLLEAIEERYSNLRTVPRQLPPIYLWGFSAGGQFAYEFACGYPKLVAGFVANKGGVYYTALASEDARRVPGLIFIGTHDAEWRKNILRGIHGLNSTFGANWQLVEETCGHSEGNSVEFSIRFFTRLLKKVGNETRIDGR